MCEGSIRLKESKVLLTLRRAIHNCVYHARTRVHVLYNKRFRNNINYYLVVSANTAVYN